MKKVILLFSIFALAACSSTPEEKPTEPTVTDATAATPTTTSVQADMGGGTTTATEPTSTSTAAMMDSTGQFPPIEGTERAATTCTSGSDTRVITTIDRKEGGCGNVYTKFGNKATIALANNDMTFCDKVHDNVKSNLENGGMNCGGGTSTATAPAPAPTETKPETKTE